MASAPFDLTDGAALAAHKILIAGGFGAGKTTLVSAISEVRPLLTEEPLSTASVGRDNLAGLPGKTTTTVALDFGRITISERLVLYLFGVPGQERFWFMWDELAYGALGAVVLADVRRLDDCFPSVNYFEKREVPFIVAVNCFDDAPRYDIKEIRLALDLDPDAPLVLCDARDHASVKNTLIRLVESIASASTPSVPTPGHSVIGR
jgi:signal recognition particle receptor subunit beta